MSRRTEQLAEAVREFLLTGDDEAMAWVHRTTRPELLAVARRIAGPDRAEDAVQAAYLSLLRKRGRRLEAPVMPWLITTVVRIAWRLVAKERRQHDLARQLARPGSDDGRVPFEEEGETVDVIREHVARLPPKYRDVVTLRVLEGLTTANVAELLDVPAATVRVRLHRGLRLLRSKLPARVHQALMALPWSLGFASGPAGAAMSQKALVATAVLLLAVTAGTWIARAGDSAPAATPADRAAQAPPASAAAPTLVVPADEATFVLGEVETTTSATSTAPAPDPATHLRLDVRGLDLQAPASDHLADVSLRIVATNLRERHEPTTQSLRLEERMYVPVEALLKATPGAAELELSVDHPAYARSTQRVLVSGQRGTASPLHATVTLTRVAAVRGRVVGSDGEPLADTQVALIPVDDVTADRVIDTTTADADGHYLLRSAASGAHRVLAVAPDHAPAQRMTTLAMTDVARLAPLELRAGATVAGQVTWGGAPQGFGLVLARCEAEPGEVRIDLGKTALLWSVDRVRRASAWSHTGEDGRFEMKGFTPGPVEVEPSSCVDLTMHMDAVRASRRTVDAPSERIDLAIQGRLLRVQVTSPTGPLTGARVAVANAAGRSLSLDSESDGSASMVVPTDVGLLLLVSAEGFAPTKSLLHVPRGDGPYELPLQLSTVDHTASMQIKSANEDHEAVEALAFVLRRPDQPPGFYEHAYFFESPAGSYEVDKLPPGTWILTVRPGGPWVGGTKPYLPVETTVTLESGKSAFVPVRAKTGARLRISARNTDGKHLPAACTLRGPDGTPSPVSFGWRDPRGGAKISTGTLLADGPNSVDPALAPGRYVVRLELAGYEPIEKAVVLERGRVAALDLTLTRVD